MQGERASLPTAVSCCRSGTITRSHLHGCRCSGSQVITEPGLRVPLGPKSILTPRMSRLDVSSV